MLFANTTMYVGKTYDFAEQDMLEAIQEHIINNKEKIEQKYEDMKQQTQDKVNNMTPVLIVKPFHARENRVFYPNTEYVNPNDIKDAKGGIIYRAGYKYDPMHYIQLPYTIVIINGDRKDEIEWLKKSDMLGTAAYRILITEGKYAEVTKALSQHIFFATDPILSRMGIKATPSIVSQEKNKLKVMEVCIDCNETK